MTDRRVPKLAPADVVVEEHDDGGFVMRSPQPLRAPAPSMGSWLERWALERPDAIVLAERPLHGDGWRTLSWSDALSGARSIGQALVDRGLSLERPVMILSGNSIDHARISFGAMLVGVPVVPVSVAYSLRSTNHAQLRSIFESVTPGLVFAEEGAPFEPALRALALDGVEVVTSRAMAERNTTLLSELLATSPGTALEMVAIDANTVAKILMTSGSTGHPKGVLNTHGMLTANQEALAQVWPFMDGAHPVIVDWLPWSHTFGGNHNLNLVLRNGGTLYIDDGRPAPGLFERTLRNLEEVAPTFQFNVPVGYAMLVQALAERPTLRAQFFSRLEGVFYAAAALPQHTWQRLDELAEQTLGHRIWLTTAWGGTETSPLVTSAHFASEEASNIGLPVPGCSLKFVPADGKLELRVRGPNVTPGYHRDPELSARAFDEEGYYRIGDAGKLVDASDPSRGVCFDGRVAEDFKLASGTWVNVGRLRTEALSRADGLLAYAVVAGHDGDEVVLLAWLDAGCAAALTDGVLPMEQWVRHAAIHAALRARLQSDASTGASRRIARVLLLIDPPLLDAGEMTDKGYVNAAAVLAHRAADVERCLRGGAADVVELADPRAD